MVRDNALAVSGLLSRKVGGPSVKPYQPAGYWAIPQLPEARMAERQRRRPVSPRPLHLLVPHVPAPEPDGLRCPEPRGMHGRTPALQHAAAGAGAAERSDLRRGGPRLRRADRRQRGDDAPAERHRVRLSAGACSASRGREETKVARGAARASTRPNIKADAKAAAETCWHRRSADAAKDIDPAELAAWTSVARVLLNLHETITRN